MNTDKAQGLALGLFLLLPGVLAADTQAERFALWNACKPIALLVMDDDDVSMGLTQEAITTTVRSRLRAARLYEAGPGPYLHVHVNRGGEMFSIRLQFVKRVSDPLSGQEGSAATWGAWATGSGGGAAHLLSQVSQRTDVFIDEYLRVNASACPRGPLTP